jgi:hypothetical protein
MPRFALPLFNSDFQNFIFIPPLPKGGGGKYFFFVSATLIGQFDGILCIGIFDWSKW